MQPDPGNPDAVIFDFDGVITDTEELHFRAFNRVFEPLGLGLSWSRYEADYIGFDDRGAFEERFREAGLELTADRMDTLCAEKLEAYLTLLLEEPPDPFPGFRPMLAQAQSWGPVAINTAALMADIAPLLAGWGLRESFDVITTIDDVSRGKPDPAGYRLTLERLQGLDSSRSISADRTVVLEDTPAGIESALGAGLRVVGIGQSMELERLHRAHARVAHLEQLVDSGYEALFHALRSDES